MKIRNIEGLTLYPSKRRTILLLIISLVFTAGGVWMISEGKPEGWLGAIFFGVCTLFSILKLVPNSSCLRISEKGFEIRSLFRGTFIRWNEVDQFESGYMGHTKKVFFNFSVQHSNAETGKKVAKFLAGFEGMLPDTYGKSADELAQLMNQWREKFLK